MADMNSLLNGKMPLLQVGWQQRTFIPMGVCRTIGVNPIAQQTKFLKNLENSSSYL
jgi:hypothetical protein